MYVKISKGRDLFIRNKYRPNHKIVTHIRMYALCGQAHVFIKAGDSETRNGIGQEKQQERAGCGVRWGVVVAALVH